MTMTKAQLQARVDELEADLALAVLSQTRPTVTWKAIKNTANDAIKELKAAISDTYALGQWCRHQVDQLLLPAMRPVLVRVRHD